ncbi:Putative peptidyl-prolyl cis-trans isomerase [Neolewinella maritima]|uniref:peptidylprolyl isomerase n=1 Tax=Neolewinella maritima TaxID=1383882 RepID=A0ABN8F453_9BACT|nr:peptidylprolyl isomerase [Neolewinella maritima]CAH0998945.1 Putative peptidyl-prolyl cis-trans isomerase [Neolewinella maritima]
MRVLLVVISLFTLAACQPSGPTHAIISTTLGDVEVKLYPETPGHTQNFIKLAEEGFFDSTLFHRVIPGFMIQGGDPLSKGAAADKTLGMGGPGYMLDAEIGAPHLYGALAAARPPQDPEKKSNGSQFFIVTGQLVDDSTLDQLERIKGITYSEAQRAAYREQGGSPSLDQDYTVFGEVVSGMDVVETIAEVETGQYDRPQQDVIIRSVTIK